jgi:hypothetical protein
MSRATAFRLLLPCTFLVACQGSITGSDAPEKDDVPSAPRSAGQAPARRSGDRRRRLFLEGPLA